MVVRTMHPVERTASFIGAWKKTQCFRTYSRRAFFDLPQTLHGGRARRAHRKSCQQFFYVIHSFPLGGNMMIFGHWVNLNTGMTPLSGVMPVNEQTYKHHIFAPYSRRTLYDLLQNLHDNRARRAHHKRWESFFDPNPIFPLRGKMLIFGYLANLNTGWRWRRFAASCQYKWFSDCNENEEKQNIYLRNYKTVLLLIIIIFYNQWI